MIFEILLELLGDIGRVGRDTSLNTQKIDKHIEYLRKYSWFNDLYNDEKYHRLFFVNRRVRMYLQSTYKTKRLINNSHAQNTFKSLLDKQIYK